MFKFDKTFTFTSSHFSLRLALIEYAVQILKGIDEAVIVLVSKHLVVEHLVSYLVGQSDGSVLFFLDFLVLSISHCLVFMTPVCPLFRSDVVPVSTLAVNWN